MSAERKSSMSKLRSVIRFGRPIKRQRNDELTEEENRPSKPDEKQEMLRREEQLNVTNKVNLGNSANKRVQNKLRKKMAHKNVNDERLSCFLEDNVDEEVFWDALEYLDSCEADNCWSEDAKEDTEEDAAVDTIRLPSGVEWETIEEELCDIPTFLHTKNCPPKLVEETRKLISARYMENPQHFYKSDFDRMLVDDWTVSRFLLRRRLDPAKAAALMEDCGRFRRQFKMSEAILSDFPIEFHRSGGLFQYLPDRVGNQVAFMRVKMYRRTSEMRDIFKSYILCLIEQCDQACQGRGTAIVFDLSGTGLRNVDLAFLSWLLYAFRNYCPKGISYILVYNLPWFLSATAKLAMTWMSENNRRSLRFVQGEEIEKFIAKENLPDYCGGTCKLNYRHIPKESKPAIELCHQWDMTVEQALKIRELFKEYLDDDDGDARNPYGEIQVQEQTTKERTSMEQLCR